MYGICSRYRERFIRGLGLGSLKEGDHFEDLGVDCRIMLKWIKKLNGRSLGLNWSGSGENRCSDCCERRTVLHTVVW